jgi:hypothetical protein
MIHYNRLDMLLSHGKLNQDEQKTAYAHKPFYENNIQFSVH